MQCMLLYTSGHYLVRVASAQQFCFVDSTDRNQYRKRKKIRGGNIFAIFVGTITPQKYSPRNVPMFYLCFISHCHAVVSSLATAA